MEINEDILIRYIDGMLTEEEAVEVKNWRAASLENEKLLEQVYFTAQVASRLKVMRTVNPDEALSRREKISFKTSVRCYSTGCGRVIHSSLSFIRFHNKRLMSILRHLEISLSG